MLVVLFGNITTGFCADLSGSVAVNQVSDTAARAKVNAMNLARRQILADVLSQYAMSDYLNAALEKTSDDELMDLIASTSVSNEQISSNAYSANITMNLDDGAVKRWLNQNNIQNWVPTQQVSGEKFSAFIVLQNGLVDWAELKRIARNDGVSIETQSITGNQIFAKIPMNYRSKFTALVHEYGWKYTDNGGVLQVWR